jgi:hypothetical protein
VTYIPIVPTVHTPPSPRTRELADLLSRVIQEYETHHPAVTGSEVREALSLAAAGSKGAPGGPRILLALLAMGLVAAGAVLFFSARLSGGGGGDPFPAAAVAVGVLLVLALAVALKRMSR